MTRGSQPLYLVFTARRGVASWRQAAVLAASVDFGVMLFAMLSHNSQQTRNNRSIVQRL